MSETLTVTFENGTGGISHKVTGVLAPTTVVDVEGTRVDLTLVGLPVSITRRPELPPMLVLTKASSTTWRLSSRTIGIPFSRIVAVEWIGSTDA